VALTLAREQRSLCQRQVRSNLRSVPKYMCETQWTEALIPSLQSMELFLRSTVLVCRRDSLKRLLQARFRGIGQHHGVTSLRDAQDATRAPHSDDTPVQDSVNSSHPLASMGRTVGKLFLDALKSSLRAGLAATLSADDLEAAVAAGLVDRSMVTGFRTCTIIARAC